MKIERLIGIVFYMINRNMVTSSQLAEYFNVSKRTILRDIDTLTLAGIPIYSESGSKGGYSINPDYRVNEKILDVSNTQYMLLALKSLKSVYGEIKVDETYEKIKHVYDAEVEAAHIDIDFSVVRENEAVISKVSELRTAMANKQVILFDYTNQKSERRQVKGHVIHVYYKWYAWYVFVHDLVKDKFLMFKIIRMDNLELTEKTYTHHYDADELLSKYSQDNKRQRLSLTIEYLSEYDTLITEYFAGEFIEESNSIIRRKISINENDFVMFSLLLGFGDKLNVVSPLSYRQRLKEHLETSLRNNYSNGDI